MILQVWYMYIAKKKFTSILMQCFRFTYKKKPGEPAQVQYNEYSFRVYFSALGYRLVDI